MAINLLYFCRCGYKTGNLDSAQKHVDETLHTLDVRGEMSARPEAIARAMKVDPDERIKMKAREMEILRRARSLGVGVK